jgi:hypothetical protein
MDCEVTDAALVDEIEQDYTTLKSFAPILCLHQKTTTRQLQTPAREKPSAVPIPSPPPSLPHPKLKAFRRQVQALSSPQVTSSTSQLRIQENIDPLPAIQNITT